MIRIFGKSCRCTEWKRPFVTQVAEGSSLETLQDMAKTINDQRNSGGKVRKAWSGDPGAAANAVNS